MTRVLVIHGAGMNMRGKSQVEVFGPATLGEISDQIQSYAQTVGVTVDIFHSNIEGEVLNALYDAHDNGTDAAIINPAGYTTGSGLIPSAIAQVRFPVIEVHVSNPTSRGTVSKIQPVCKGSVYGFGIYGYFLALDAAKHITAT